jgi:hypothetical protein
MVPYANLALIYRFQDKIDQAISVTVKPVTYQSRHQNEPLQVSEKG